MSSLSILDSPASLAGPPWAESPPVRPFVVALCPTYRRPELLENSIACFEAQTYPARRRHLVILDDAGELPATRGPSWTLHTRPTRCESLCAKYNELVGLARALPDGPVPAIFCVWEDDDLYAPEHIATHVRAYERAGALGTAAWCKPPYVWTTHPREYVRRPWTERADGRFHASISLTGEMFGAVGGWPATRAPNFDQQFMAAMHRLAPPLVHEPPWTYTFRWADTGAYHGQAFGDNWWERIPEITTPQPRTFVATALRPRG